MRATSTIELSQGEENTWGRGYADLRWQLIILGIFRFSEALAWTTIFPYAFFMMRSFIMSDAKRDAEAAAYAALTVALFTFGEFLTSLVWAKVSDRLGRKPTLMIGIFGGIVSALAFGLSTRVWVALAARAFGGLVNPNVGVISACVGEIVKRKEHQGAYVNLKDHYDVNNVLPQRQSVLSSPIFERAWVSDLPEIRTIRAYISSSSLIGPVIGGHLADPVNNIPSMFRKGSLWETFPYLLPNLVVVVFILISGFLGFFFLEESHPHMQHRRDMGLIISKCFGRRFRSLFGHIDTRREYAIVGADENSISLTSMDESKYEEASGEHYEQIETCSPPSLTPAASSRIDASAYTTQVILQILAVSLLAFHKVASDVIIPIFLATSSVEETSIHSKRNVFEGRFGFGMLLPNISNVLLSQAFIAIMSQMLIVPRVIDHIGPLQTFRWTLFAFPWLYCMTPFTARLPGPLSIIAILLDLWAKGILVNLGYVASSIMLTRATPAPEKLATVNGAAATIGCLARSIGAGVSGSMFHMGLTSGYIGLPFWTLALIAAAAGILSCFLREEPQNEI